MLSIKNITKFYMQGGRPLEALKDINFEMQAQEVLGLVGESGSGKSTLAKILLRMEKPNSGKIYFHQQDFSKLNQKAHLDLCRKIQIVFQNPYFSLNPQMTLKQILNEPLDIHQLHTKELRSQKIYQLLDQVGLAKSHLDRYPHQFSGGQRQRICIARALSVSPELLICDEPLSALDLSIQAQILELLKNCKEEMGLSLLFISHDLATVELIADRVAVMYKGEIIESGMCEQVFKNPLKAYTKQLLQSM
ncbi:MAG: hypothetical protein BGO14_03750 [Chlamydiales bacterium 38-26]|nr:ABC transporter ATP-binding protein [Chlamydiales bacterium]OJV09447.1 MAG: hypothetical protein BGO14_03750 [Chlamydiales bacterium 38-26]